MNLKVVLKTTGKIILLESALLILPLFISIYYKFLKHLDDILC